MIFGIGTDIVNIKRIQNSLARLGERFARRILTPSELMIFQQHVKPAHYLAKRFAVKEAVVKALGTGMRQGLSFQDIEVRSNSLGQPSLHYSQKLQILIDAQAITHSHLSIADEHEFAVAYVVLEAKDVL